MEETKNKATKSRIPESWKIVPGGIQRPGCSNGWIVIDASEGYNARKVVIDNKGRGYASYPAALKAAYYIYNKDAYAEEERQFMDFLDTHKDFRDALTERHLFHTSIELDDVISARKETNTDLPWTDKKFLKLYLKQDKKNSRHK